MLRGSRKVAMDWLAITLSLVALGAEAGWTIFHKDSSTAGHGRHRSRDRRTA
jgi:hypothetical protein